ncbi:MAG: hypothetical protein EB127_05555 [Alphaproteobacteria bacterium]|nr:hypothetical protein [Alphaproteobacteria bacterium]
MSAEMDIFSTTINTNKVSCGVAYIVTKSCYHGGNDYTCTEVYSVKDDDYCLEDVIDHPSDVKDDELELYHKEIVSNWSN